jgi:hypothetical protein
MKRAGARVRFSLSTAGLIGRNHLTLYAPPLDGLGAMQPRLGGSTRGSVRCPNRKNHQSRQGRGVVSAICLDQIDVLSCPKDNALPGL